MDVLIDRDIKGQDKVTDVFSLECKVSRDVSPEEREKIRKKVDEILDEISRILSRLLMMVVFMSSVSVWLAGNLTFNS